jgi:hypothetical protein
MFWRIGRPTCQRKLRNRNGSDQRKLLIIKYQRCPKDASTVSCEILCLNSRLLKILAKVAKALKMEISGNGLKKFALAPTYRALNGTFRTISFAFWKYTLTELNDDPGEPVLNPNPDLDPLGNDFNRKYIVWTIVSF